jgi:hypothetical protein
MRRSLQEQPRHLKRPLGLRGATTGLHFNPRLQARDESSAGLEVFCEGRPAGIGARFTFGQSCRWALPVTLVKAAEEGGKRYKQAVQTLSEG